MFIVVKDRDSGLRVCVNTDDISRVEERIDGCVIYFRTVADDFDKTKHQMAVATLEKYDEVEAKMKPFVLR